MVRFHRDEELTEDEQQGMLSLSVSFRLLPGIIGFVNDMFSQLMGSEAEGYEVAYESMIAGRNISDDVLQSEEKGSITFLLR
jgi:ATP-dependent exoDNAse (exonuclease V) beta subunit